MTERERGLATAPVLLPRFALSRLDREMDKDGIGWSPARARERAMPRPVIVFQREDGWTLGAGTADAERLAYESWRGHWTLFAVGPSWAWRPISEYQP